VTPKHFRGHPERSLGHAVLLLVSFVATAAAQTASYYVLPPESRTPAAQSTRSILFDLKAAENLRLQGQPLYVESITVVGEAEPPKKSVEKRFADSLNSPVAGMIEYRPMASTPCLSMASTRPDIGSWFTPLTGCPR
jgi:hypothetical protein